MASNDSEWQRQLQAEKIRDEFERAWLDGPIPNLRAYLERHSEIKELLGADLVELDVHYRLLRGETLSFSDYADFPPEWLVEALNAAEEPSTSLKGPALSSYNSRNSRDKHDPTLPTSIDRFPVIKRLGKGGFGEVYLARDPDLDRLVAIKVPTAGALRMLRHDWMKEARIVARLDHPRIVPVYHVGSTPEFPAFIVSKFIPGGSLADRLKQSLLPLSEALELVIDVAETLDYVHRFEYRMNRALVHRDIKPSNLLLDQQGKVYVADFGLAVEESELEQADASAGTPQYSSPEQVAGEGHKIDGRTDIFALGVVLYELLTGRRPFQATDLCRLKQQITYHDPKPPRQLNAEVSLELERICLKALAKLSSERYSAARDFASDLRRHRDRGEAVIPLPGSVAPTITPLSDITLPSVAPRANLAAISRVLGRQAISPLAPVSRVVPKGLRSFDSQDAGFFLELLPGARDAEGLPESIRFWKQRIDPNGGADSFKIGVLFGPSGCGKTSLIKAGLLPRLSSDILTLYVEATTDDTEQRVNRLLHRALPHLAPQADLIQNLTAVRRGEAKLGSRKLLLVLDQFEQWLHSHWGEEDALLTRALRQCDADNLQCLLLVRDDYTLGVYRFLRILEVRLDQGANNAVVDRFDTDHARKVLIAFGRAFGKLPDETQEQSELQDRFITEAIAGLSEQHLVVPVRLALFAEMFRTRPWTPAALFSVGGSEGVGRLFLEETFRSAKAPPQYRIHARGAQEVLVSLLPEAGSDIKGHRRSREELVHAAGYAHRPADAVELFRILDNELRLISPVESDVDNITNTSDVTSSQSHFPIQHNVNYHLAHDYLVPSMRRWLEDILGDTSAGRAKLLLRERSRLWNDRKKDRHLPSIMEHLRIRRWVTPTEQSPSERQMLARAAQVHTLWTALTMMGLLLLAVGAGYLWQERRQREAVYLVERLEVASAREWNRTFETLRKQGLQSLADASLRERLSVAVEERDSLREIKMRAGLFALVQDASQLQNLAEDLLTLPKDEFGVVLELLEQGADRNATEILWRRAIQIKKNLDRELSPEQSNQFIRAVAALSSLGDTDPKREERWTELIPAIARVLASQQAADIVAWQQSFGVLRPLIFKEALHEMEQNDQKELLKQAEQGALLEYARKKEIFQSDLPFTVAKTDGGPWCTTPEYERWIKNLSRLSTADQVRRIELRTRELNAGFSGKFNMSFNESQQPIALSIDSSQLRDISPLKALRDLPRFQSLTRLDLGLRPGQSGQVADLRPLRGLPLKRLVLSRNSVQDLSPLEGMPLTELVLTGCKQLTSLEPLRNMPLRELVLNETYHNFDNLDALQNLTSLEGLFVSATRLTSLQKLSRLRLKTLAVSGNPLQSLEGLDPSALSALECHQTPIKDLSVLREAKNLVILNCSETRVTDISPLADLPELRDLNLVLTPVTDFSPLDRIPNLKNLVPARPKN
jgi:serine/threonine protein kinase/Leucine-rich repeat (LRR) protein